MIIYKFCYFATGSHTLVTSSNNGKVCVIRNINFQSKNQGKSQLIILVEKFKSIFYKIKIMISLNSVTYKI